MTGPRYAELQVTSQFSFLRGASSAQELFATAALMVWIAGRAFRAGALSDVKLSWKSFGRAITRRA